MKIRKRRETESMDDDRNLVADICAKGAKDGSQGRARCEAERSARPLEVEPDSSRAESVRGPRLASFFLPLRSGGPLLFSVCRFGDHFLQFNSG